ncbi:YcaO-like family protein [Micromonospora sp. WMMD737]|uniref:YcaO-like family protein n=1 Tax=Micromonospora sp. WMMD737 TaxID=3404113 RepID=UPI003B953D1B
MDGGRRRSRAVHGRRLATRRACTGRLSRAMVPAAPRAPRVLGNGHCSRLHVFDITIPEKIPALWLMLVDGEGRPGQPKAFCDAGAHLDPERALWAGLVELAR